MRMKKNYVTIISLLIICAAAVIYAASHRGAGNTALKSLHDYVDPADLQAVSIERAGRRAELVARGAAWYLRDGDLLIAADAGAMVGLLEFINTAGILRRVTEKPDAWPQFELNDGTALAVTLQAGGKRSTVYVGKKKDQATQFVRLPDDPAVYLVSKTLDTGAEPWRWQYRQMLQYAPGVLAAVDYDCGGKKLHLQRDAQSGNLAPRDVPHGRISADLGKIAESFRDIPVAEYVPRDRAPQADALVAHTLYFTDGSSATLRFIDRDEKNDRPPCLDIVFGGAGPSDEQLRYARDVCARYVFSLSWIDPSKYLKGCDEFFADPHPVAEAAGDAPVR